jgi:inorganic pyrophosphatase
MQTTISHPWHGVSPGDQLPEYVNAIIEIPKGSKAKYEIDKKTGLLKLDRVLFSSVHYPANYGFIPQSFCEDNDPLDILVISQIDLAPLSLCKAKVIGVMRMLDKNEADDKIIAVAADDVSMNSINELEELPPYLLAEIHRFYEDYKKLESKSNVLVDAFLSKSDAFKIILDSLALYHSTFLSAQ